VRDLPCMEFRTTIFVEVYRVCCPDCGIKIEKVPQLPSKAPFSKHPVNTVAMKIEKMVVVCQSQQKLMKCSGRPSCRSIWSSFVYKEGRRIVEPHDYGVRKGSVKLLGYQLSGASSGPLPNWRWFEVDLITGIRLLDRRFRGGRGGEPGSSGNHNEWDELFLRVEPAEGAD
jgi:hypothetical protein